MNKRILPGRAAAHAVREWLLRLEILGRWVTRNVRARRHHGLAGELIISLTSYPPRFPTLALTLRCLLTQSVKPDRVVLWVAADDVSQLPGEVLALRKAGLAIEGTPDVKSYKKILPALERFPGAYVATADDDVYYNRRWLARLVNAYEPGRKQVVCLRAARIVLGDRGLPAPYLSWIPESATGSASPLTFPTGVGGVLYEPGIFHPEVQDLKSIYRLCPTADDVWLYFMAGRNGATWKLAFPNTWVHCWRQSQDQALMAENVYGGGNDRQIDALVNAYGFEWASECTASMTH